VTLPLAQTTFPAAPTLEMATCPPCFSPAMVRICTGAVDFGMIVPLVAFPHSRPVTVNSTAPDARKRAPESQVRRDLTVRPGGRRAVRSHGRCSHGRCSRGTRRRMVLLGRPGRWTQDAATDLTAA